MPVVDIIFGNLAVGPEEVAEAATLLETTELERAGQFRFERDHRRFVVRRARLRQVLASVVGGHPRDLRFVSNEYGKPMLATSPLKFSASHSDERWLVAMGAHDLGVDCERIEPATGWHELAHSLFCPSEVAALELLPPKIGVRAFFDCWARKEAFVKALGVGLTYPLDAFSVSVTLPATLLSGGEGWTIVSLPLGPDFSGALVTADNGSPLEVRFHPDVQVEACA